MATSDRMFMNHDRVAEQLKSVLTAAHHNLGVVINQLESLDDDNPMPEVIESLTESREYIEAELGKL